MTPVLQFKRAKLLELLGLVHLREGCIAEFGVFRGATLKALAEKCPDKRCYGFDTFAGMPAEKCQAHDGHVAGDFGEVDYEAVQASMPPNVTLKRGVFPETAEDVDERFCFAHVDFDLEASMADAIAWIVPRTVAGGIVVFDDWHKKTMPGVDAAIAAAGLRVLPASKHQGFWVKQ